MSEGAAERLEERLARLEEIVRALEDDGLELDEALGVFEEAVAHLRATEALLEAAQLKVDELLGTLEQPVLRALDEDVEATEEGPEL